MRGHAPGVHPDTQRDSMDRITAQDVKRIEQFDSNGAPVLSAYLDLRPERQLERAYAIAFKSLVREVRQRLDERGRKQLDAEAKRVAAWLEGEPPQGKGLAVFSCEPAGLWESYYLPFPVRDHLAFEEKPYVTPLLDLLDEYERYGVVLIDQERARFFTVFFGQIEEDLGFRDIVKVQDYHSGWPEEKYERRETAHIHKHVKRVAQCLMELYRRRPFDRLILGGEEEQISDLRRLLPRSLAERIAGTFHADLDAGEAEILAETLAIEQRIERTAEDRLVTELLETVAAGGRGACGAEPTLEALWEGAVQKLVVAEGLHLAGVECTSCRRLVAGSPAQCPICGGPVRPLDDLVERAAERTIEQDGAVEVVHGDAAQCLQQEGGGLCAHLRFRSAAGSGQVSATAG
jgi:peptide chain release factor subunit 1